MSAHEVVKSHDERDPPSLKSFGLTFAAVFAVIGVWSLVLHGGAPRYWALAIASVFLLLTLVAPQLLAPLNKIWFAIGMLLHRVVNPLVLGLLFIVIISPLALVLRLFGKKFLPTTFDGSAKSYWISRSPPGPDPQSLKNQF